MENNKKNWVVYDYHFYFAGIKHKLIGWESESNYMMDKSYVEMFNTFKKEVLKMDPTIPFFWNINMLPNQLQTKECPPILVMEDRGKILDKLKKDVATREAEKERLKELILSFSTSMHHTLRSPFVKEVQNFIMKYYSHEKPLPKYGVDGIYGEETRNAINKYIIDGIKEDKTATSKENNPLFTYNKVTIIVEGKDYFTYYKKIGEEVSTYEHVILATLILPVLYSKKSNRPLKYDVKKEVISSLDKYPPIYEQIVNFLKEKKQAPKASLFSIGETVYFSDYYSEFKKHNEPYVTYSGKVYAITQEGVVKVRLRLSNNVTTSKDFTPEGVLIGSGKKEVSLSKQPYEVQVSWKMKGEGE